jgi:hypothetical protein
VDKVGVEKCAKCFVKFLVGLGTVKKGLPLVGVDEHFVGDHQGLELLKLHFV